MTTVLQNLNKTKDLGNSCSSSTIVGWKKKLTATEGYLATDPPKASAAISISHLKNIRLLKGTPATNELCLVVASAIAAAHDGNVIVKSVSIHIVTAMLELPIVTGGPTQ